MYPITDAVKALFDAEHRQVLRITGMAPMKAKTISIYSGDTKIFESGAGQSIAVYSGDTEIYNNSDSTEIDVYSGDKLIYYYDKDGLYSLTITDADVLFDGFSIDRYCCNGEKLEVGTAIAGQMTLKLNNTDGRFDNVIFEGMEMFVEIGIADWTQSEPTITYIPCGYYTPDMQPRRLNHIDLTCLDRMTRFDVVVEPTDLTLPATVAGLVGQMNALCGVTLAESIDTLPNADVVITELPTVTGDMTYRNLLQWCAGIMATNAWFDWNGLLRFTWYGTETDYETTTGNRFDSDYYEEDLTITGAVYTNSSGVEIVEGTDDYAIDLTGNALAGPLIATVLPEVNTVVNGLSYRPLTAAVVNAPYLWPMDAIDFTDKDGNTYSSVLTNVAFGLNGTTALESKGLTYAINKRAQPKGVTKEQTQFLSEVAKTIEDNIDASLTQEEIFNRLTDNGAARGLFLTQDGQLYINASYIYSGLLTLGGLNNENGTMRVLDANGNVICTLNNTGVDITEGSVATYSQDRLLRTILSNGEVSVQYWGQDSGTGQYMWKDMLAVTADSDGSMVKASTGALTLRGKDEVHLSNRSGTTDTVYATADMEDADLKLHVWSAPGGAYEGDSTFEMGSDSVKMSVGDGDPTTDDPTVELTRNGLEANVKRVDVTATDGGLNFTATYMDLSGNIETGTMAYDGDTLDVDGALSVSDSARTRTNLGITPANIGAVSTSDVIDIGHGGTGASNAAAARTNLGITPANIGAYGVNSIDVSGGLNDNTLYGTAWVNGADVSTLPTTDYYELMCFGNVQLALRYNGSNPSILYRRYYVNSQWYGWTPVVGLSTSIQINTASWSDIYAKLSVIEGGKSAFFWITDGTVASFISGRSDLAWTSGYVTNVGSGGYRFSAFNASGISYTWVISGLTSASATATVGTVSRSAYDIDLYNNSTSEAVYNELIKIPLHSSGAFTISSTTFGLLTQNKVTNGGGANVNNGTGTVSHVIHTSTSDTFKILCSGGTTNMTGFIFQWNVTLSKSGTTYTITAENVYGFTYAKAYT